MSRKVREPSAEHLRICAYANMALCTYTHFLLGKESEKAVYHWIDKVSLLSQQDCKDALFIDQSQKALHCVNKIRSELKKKKDEECLPSQLSVVPLPDKRAKQVKINTASTKIIFMPTPLASDKKQLNSVPKKRLTHNSPADSGASTPVLRITANGK